MLLQQIIVNQFDYNMKNFKDSSIMKKYLTTTLTGNPKRSIKWPRIKKDGRVQNQT